MPPQAGAPQLMRKINRALILNLLRLNGPMSRADLSRATNLAIPTISRRVGALIDQEYVREAHIGEVPLGKPPMMLELNAEGAFVVGLDITATYIEVAIVNLCGEVSHFKRHPVHLRMEDIDDIVAKVKSLTGPALDSIPPDRLLGLGIAIPGVVDTHTGTTIYAANESWHNNPIVIKGPLEKALNVPVTVNSRMRARALAEQFYGGGVGLKNFLWIYAGSRGLGAGIVLDGRLYHGANHGSGEIGHNRVDSSPNQPICPYCGQHGCLSILTSHPGVLARVERARQTHPDSLLAREPIASLRDIDAYAQQGDEASQHIIAETGRYLGIGLADITHLLNPSHIFMGGSVTQLGPALLEATQRTVRGIVLPPYQDVQIQLSELGAYAPTIGAATLFFRNLFEPPQ
jgi:N-acetylglucosamine repressor